MKKYSWILVLCGLLSVSCAEDEPDCMSCHIEITDHESGKITKQSDNTYCDEKLDNILVQKPIVLSEDQTSEWVCK